MKRDYHFGDYYIAWNSFFIMDNMGNAHPFTNTELDQNQFFYVNYFGDHFTYWD